MKRFTLQKALFYAVLTFFLSIVYSCAGTAQPAGPEAEKTAEKPAKLEPEAKKVQETAAEEAAREPLEVEQEEPIAKFSAEGNLLGEMRTEAYAGEALMVLSRAELQAHRKANEETIYSELYPAEKFGLQGFFWETAAKRNSEPYTACGFVGEAGGKVYYLSLSSGDEHERAAFAAEFDKTFADFKPDLGEGADSGPSISPDHITSYRSEALGYSWNVKDTVWHFWHGVSKQNSDPDLVLTNKDEEISLFVYGAMVPEEDVGERELFKVLLRRLGVGSVQTKKKHEGGFSVTTFTATRTVGGYDFAYTGKFFYESGRGILAAAWTQGILKKEYGKLLDRAVEGIQMEAAPEARNDLKANKFNAAVLGEIGMMRLEEDQPLAALAYFERAGKMDPEEPLYLINCGFVYQLKELYGPGINHFLSQMELVEKNAKLLAILGEMYEAVYDYGNARKYVELSLRYTPNEPESVINLSDALWGLGQRSQSLEVVRDLYERQPSSRLGVYVAKTYMGLDQYAEAVDLLYETREQFGPSKELGETLADALLFLARYREALAASEEAARLAPNNSRILTQQGKALFYLQNYKKAEAVLARAVELEKENEDAKSFLSTARAFLGKADNKTLRTPIKPVEERRKLDTLLHRDAAKEAKAEGHSSFIHERRETMRAGKGENWTRTEELVVEILDSRGASVWQEFSYPFLPGFDRIYLNALDVYDSTLTLKYSVSISGSYITYTTESGGANEAQTAHFPLKELYPGDIIYLQISRTGINDKGSIPYLEFRASREIPTAKTSFRIYADTTKFVTEEYGPLVKEGKGDGVEWSIENPIVVRNEIYMPDYRDFGAGLLLTGKRDWQAIGEDYENLIRHQYRNAVAVREKAFEVRGNKIGQEAVLAEIRFVRDNIRYRDVRFGGHSLIPQTAERTLKDHRGDCKDQALLLKELLATIGVNSNLAAVPLTGNGFATLPSIQQFDHMILYIPAGKDYQEMWVDPTDKTGNDRPVPLEMEGKTAFIIDGKESRVAAIPVLEDNQEHKAKFHHRLHLAASGAAEFRDSISLEGKFAAAMRNIFYGREQKDQERLLENLIRQSVPDANLAQMRTENLSDFDKPFVLVATFGSKNYFGQSSDGIKGKFPNVWERSLLRLPKVGKRFLPIRMPHEAHFESVMEVTADAGLKPEVQEPSLGREAEYVSFEKLENGIAWTTFALYADPSEYEKIREEWNFLLDYSGPQIIVR